MRSWARSLLLISLLFILSSFGFSSPFKIGALLNFYQLADPVYKDVYGKGNLQYGICLNYGLSKNLEIFLEADYFSATGSMTVSKEKVVLSISSLLVGFRFPFMDVKNIKPYIGIGGGAYFFREDEPSRLEDVSEITREIHAEGGIYLAITKKLWLDLNFRYALANAKPFGETIKLGGIRAGMGIGFRL